MSVSYKLISRINPQDRTLPEKYYARAISTGKDDIYSLAAEIAPNTTMGKADIIGVLTALGEVIPRRLALGRTVDLLDLAIFAPSVNSEGVENPDDFNATAHIKRVKINDEL